MNTMFKGFVKNTTVVLAALGLTGLVACTEEMTIDGVPSARHLYDTDTGAPSGYQLPIQSRLVNVKVHEGEQLILPYDISNEVESQYRLFSDNSSIDALRSTPDGIDLSDLRTWYRLVLVNDADARQIINRLRKLDNVALVESASATLSTPAPSSVGDISTDQEYLDDPPVGLGSRYAWGFDGGKGAGVTMFDIEYLWNIDHEDLPQVDADDILLPPGHSLRTQSD